MQNHQLISAQGQAGKRTSVVISELDLEQTRRSSSTLCTPFWPIWCPGFGKTLDPTCWVG
jgi:hypothetical protein